MIADINAVIDSPLSTSSQSSNVSPLTVGSQGQSSCRPRCRLQACRWLILSSYLPQSHERARVQPEPVNPFLFCSTPSDFRYIGFIRQLKTKADHTVGFDGPNSETY